MLNGPAKITLKNTTKMTLNARFTTIMKSRPPPSSSNGSSSSSRMSMASEKNRRLAQQMEERTSSGHDNYGGNRGAGPSRDYSPPRNRAPRPKPQPVSVLDRIGNKPMRGGGRGGFRGGRGGTALNRTRGGGVRGRFSNGGNNRFNNNSGFRGGRGRGRGGRGRGGRDPASKDDLDAEMDAYRADRN